MSGALGTRSLSDGRTVTRPGSVLGDVVQELDELGASGEAVPQALVSKSAAAPALTMLPAHV